MPDHIHLPPGATAFCVAIEPQPKPTWIPRPHPDGVLFRARGNVKRKTLRKFPYRPGDTISTTDGPRRVRSVRAVRIEDIAEDHAEAIGARRRGLTSRREAFSRKFRHDHPGAEWLWYYTLEPIA